MRAQNTISTVVNVKREKNGQLKKNDSLKKPKRRLKCHNKIFNFAERRKRNNFLSAIPTLPQKTLPQ